MEAENKALRARVGELNEQLALLLGNVADLEKLAGRNSSTSSKPPSTDPGSAKSARPENANRAVRRALGRQQGKQPGAPGTTLAQVAGPDVVVTRPWPTGSAAAGTVVAGTPTYTPNAAIRDTNGNAVSTTPIAAPGPSRF